MAYVKGIGIASSDYNSYAGVTTVAAASSAAATGKAGCLWGVGYGDRGYGQAAPSLTAITSGSSIASAPWTNLRTTMANLATWQNSAATLIPPAANLGSGAGIVAHNSAAPSSNPYSIPDELALLDTNRLNYVVGNMTLTASATSSTRATTWGQGATGITCELSVTFASEDAARYFFNSGGELRIALAHPSTATNRDTAWNTVLASLVTGFRANASARLTGSYGTAQAVGYYQLTTAYQTILDGSTSFVSPYSVNSFLVQAKANTITGLNGAKGSVLYFKVILNDTETNAFQDVVQSGTNAVLSHLRATTTLGLAAPTCAVVTAF